MVNGAQNKPGDFSLGQVHEFMGAFGRSGGDPEMLQNAIEKDWLMKKVIDLIKDGGLDLIKTGSHQGIRDFLGPGCFFGIEEWQKYFPDLVLDKYELGLSTKFPWNTEILKSLQVNFVFWGPGYVNRKTFTINIWKQLLTDVLFKKNYSERWFRLETIPLDNNMWFDSSNRRLFQEYLSSRWYAFSFPHQIDQKIPDLCTEPNILELTTAMILSSLMNHKFPINNTYLRTRDSNKGFGAAGVRCLTTGNTIHFSYENEQPRDFSLCFSLKRPSN